MAKKKTATKDKSPKVHLLQLFPNMVTILGLCVGLSSLRYALEGRYEMAVAAVVVAAVIDMLDGRLARMLNATSDFGAHLDSLSDLVNFGIAPMFILYLWKLELLGSVGWACSLFYVICCMIRLARFNTHMDHPETQPSWAGRFFVGMPAPAAGLLALAPLALLFVVARDVPDQLLWHDDTFMRPAYLAIYASVIGLLMVSRLPMVSFKKMSIPRHIASLVMAAGGLMVIFAISKPWVFLLAAGAVYMLSIPIVLAMVLIDKARGRA